ncbi:MAG: hypothetical protein M3Y83_02005 [Actinomycetota bacterium]|nr:hypothetical protein [Actinomycetota bacterium]
MDESRRLRGIELRYALTNYLAQHGRCTIAELIHGLTCQGFELGANAPKAVSDALRWEIAHERVRRRSRGVYLPVDMPRSTAHRIHQRVLALRAQALVYRAATARGDDFWDRLPDAM